MAALALVFLAEKNWRHGAGLNRLVGTAIALLGCAVLLYPDLLALLSGVTATSTSM
jgi:hypothetical protein